MHYVYILHTEKFQKFYVGETENINVRLQQHNEHFFKAANTTYATDWVVVKLIEVENRKDARVVEKYIKSMKSKLFIEKIISSDEFYKGFKRIVWEKFEISIS